MTTERRHICTSTSPTLLAPGQPVWPKHCYTDDHLRFTEPANSFFHWTTICASSINRQRSFNYQYSMLLVWSGQESNQDLPDMEWRIYLLATSDLTQRKYSTCTHGVNALPQGLELWHRVNELSLGYWNGRRKCEPKFLEYL